MYCLCCVMARNEVFWNPIPDCYKNTVMLSQDKCSPSDTGKHDVIRSPLDDQCLFTSPVCLLHFLVYMLSAVQLAQCVSAFSKKHNICHCILRRSIRACWNALLYSQVILDADYTDCNTSLVLMIDIKKSASHSVVVDTSRFGQGKEASLIWVQLWSASPSLLMYLMVPNSIFQQA